MQRYLISYSPLANSTHGRGVAAQKGIPPYVDASCRREPDFESIPPFVSGLCRENFVKALRVGDVLAYITNKSTLHPEGRRLPAILQLDKSFPSHAAAAAWYRANGQRLPSSCIVPGNDPAPMALTDPKLTCAKEEYPDSKAWSEHKYVPRAERCEQCFSCRVVHSELDSPPIVDDAFWDQHLRGGLPTERMQNSGLRITERFYNTLLTHAGINLT